ncbi:hypothetical protein EVA_14906 [gut metagenome]|uniref:Uncharacterized protein n=1 Tax=gut metagenome TaxID=749906 RepID=J9G588_9ZZZZ
MNHHITGHGIHINLAPPTEMLAAAITVVGKVRLTISTDGLHIHTHITVCWQPQLPTAGHGIQFKTFVGISEYRFGTLQTWHPFP